MVFGIGIEVKGNTGNTKSISTLDLKFKFNEFEKTNQRFESTLHVDNKP